MSQSGLQHPKADVGGQRGEPKDSHGKKPEAQPSAKDALDASKKAPASKDAKK